MGHQCPTLLRLEVRSEASASPIDIREMIEIDKKVNNTRLNMKYAIQMINNDLI